MKRHMQSNSLIVVVPLFILCMAFTGCNKYATCILWQKRDYERQQFEKFKAESKCCKQIVGVVMDREGSKFYTKQMVRRMVDTLLHYTADIEEIEIYPIEQDFNTRKEGVYLLHITYAHRERIIACVFSDGKQFVLPPHPEEIVEVRKNVEVSDSIREMRRGRRAAIARDFFKEDDYITDSFMRGYWRYRLFVPSFSIR